MKKIMVVIFCVVLSVCLLCSCENSSGAGQETSSKIEEFNSTRLNEELSLVESLKRNYDVEDINFYELTTADMIPVYDVDENGVRLKNECLPLFYEGVLRMIAYKTPSGGYQIYSVAKESDIKADAQMAFLVIDNDLAAYNNGTSAKYLTLSAHPDGSSVNIADMGLNLDGVKFIDGTKNIKVIYEPQEI